MFTRLAISTRKFLGDPDLAIDLGTANTRLYARGKGLIADQPSVVSRQLLQGSMRSGDARAAAGRSQHIFPLRAGVVTNVEAAAELLRPIFHRARRFGLMRPRALACAPTDATEEERG